MENSETIAPPARLTLRAHNRSPARVELRYRPLPGRLLRALGWIVGCWGSIPFLLWIPPHYPWVTVAFLAGVFLALRSVTGRYAVRSFAGICPRCGSPLSLGLDRAIDLPHTLTCFHCHFEPRLEVEIDTPTADGAPDGLEHQSLDCVGSWERRWLADEPFLYCALCRGGAPASAAHLESAEAESEVSELLDRLADEGKYLM